MVEYADDVMPEMAITRTATIRAVMGRADVMVKEWCLFLEEI